MPSSFLCGPACIQLGFQQAALVTNQVFAGSLGADALAAAAIGFTVSIRTPLLCDSALKVEDCGGTVSSCSADGAAIYV